MRIEIQEPLATGQAVAKKAGRRALETVEAARSSDLLPTAKEAKRVAKRAARRATAAANRAARRETRRRARPGVRVVVGAVVVSAAVAAGFVLVRRLAAPPAPVRSEPAPTDAPTVPTEYLRDRDEVGRAR